MFDFLEYYVARFDLRSDQLEMLKLIFTIKSDRIRRFCLNSLIKDKILQKIENCSTMLRRTISDKNPDYFFIHIMEKYIFDENNNLPLESYDENFGNVSQNHVTEFVKKHFYELLENYSIELSAMSLRDNDSDKYRQRLYGTIILNTLIHYGFLKLIDAAQLEVTKEDFL